jgi:hypothetical protein
MSKKNDSSGVQIPKSSEHIPNFLSPEHHHLGMTISFSLKNSGLS